MYDKNGHLKQVIYVKCNDSLNHLAITRFLTGLGVEFTATSYSIHLSDIDIFMSQIYGYNVDDLLEMLDRRYSK